MSFVQVEIKPQGYAIINLKREPVNSMNLDFWQQISKAFASLEQNPKVRGVIFQSGVSKAIFAAGNDLNELYAPSTSLERFTEFWTVSNQFLANVLNSKLVTVAALNGACPAGGTALGLACDYRVASEDVSMGLNETALGISVPPVWIKMMTSVIGQGKTDKLVQFAVMVSGKEALKIGLIDQLVEKREMLLPTAEAVIQQLLRIPDLGRQLVKGSLRDGLAEEFGSTERLRQESAASFQMLSQPSTIKALAGVLARLSKSKM